MRLSFASHRRFMFDSETGGLSPQTADMVEVAAIVTDPTGKQILARYAQKVFPKKPVEEGAARVNGYDPKVWEKEAIPIEVAMKRMIELAQHCVFVAHNGNSFDWPFFEAAMQACGLRWPGDYRKIDTMQLAIPLFQHGLIENLRLGTLARELGVRHDDVHSAYGDVCALRGIYVKLMRLYAGVPTRFQRLREKRVAKTLAQ